jgi:hypothetical protein
MVRLEQYVANAHIILSETQIQEVLAQFTDEEMRKLAHTTQNFSPALANMATFRRMFSGQKGGVRHDRKHHNDQHRKRGGGEEEEREEE